METTREKDSISTGTCSRIRVSLQTSETEEDSHGTSGDD